MGAIITHSHFSHENKLPLGMTIGPDGRSLGGGFTPGSGLNVFDGATWSAQIAPPIAYAALLAAAADGGIWAGTGQEGIARAPL